MGTKAIFLTTIMALGLVIWSIYPDGDQVPFSNKINQKNSKQVQVDYHTGERNKPTLSHRGVPIPEDDGSYIFKGRDEFGREEITKGLTLTQYQFLNHVKSDNHRPYFKWVEKIDEDTLEKIFSKLKPMSSAIYTAKPVMEWREGYDAVVTVANLPLDIGDPRLIYQNNDYFLFAHENHPEFQKGYAVEKKTGTVSRWEIRGFK